MPAGMKLKGKAALVTGASRGIGRETALALGRAGASVALVARDRSALEAVADAIGPDRSLIVAADLADTERIAGVVRETLVRFGRIDVLVNNAGVLGGRDFLETSPEEIARIVDVNFRATAVLTRIVAERMAARRTGHIVNVASLAGVVGTPGEAVYAGAKAASRVFTSSLRVELDPYRIDLTDVVLGTVKTGMLDEAESNPRVHRLFDRGRRLGVLADTPAEDVAAAIVQAIERRRPVVVLPTRAWLLYMPLQGLARSVVNRLAR
ncbi:MAG: SDR family NAD(P)-dependent oxidoreductase [Dehalococcoidia bacterium]